MARPTRRRDLSARPVLLALVAAGAIALGTADDPKAQEASVVVEPVAPGAETQVSPAGQPAPAEEAGGTPAAAAPGDPPRYLDAGGASEVAANGIVDQRILPLTSLTDAGDLQLRGRFARLDLEVPVEREAVVRGATLKLAYQSAPSLLSEASRMVVSMNGEALAELPLSPRRGQTRAEITLLAEEIGPGSDLTLSVWQEHREGCSLALSRDLWTQIDPANSYLALEIGRADRDLVLSDLGRPNWPLGRDGGAVTLITADPLENDLWLRVGGLIAQGLALRLDGRPLIIDHHVALPEGAGEPDAGLGLVAGGPTALPPGNNVLMGTFDQLLTTLGLEIAGGIKGPYIGVHRLDQRNPDGVLVVSGVSEEDVLYAATVFANPGFELPDAVSTTVDEMPLVQHPPRAFVQAGRTQTLEQWALSGSDRSRGDDRRMSFVLMLPPEFYVADNRKAELRVNYGYKPNVGAGSALHVLVNGEYAGLINLQDSAEGGIVDGQAVRLPLRLFRPGRNVLAFEPALTNADAVGCSQFVDGGPSVGVFGDSTLSLPMVSEVVSQPDLGLFASLGFPFGDAEIDAPTSLVATSYDPSTIGAAFTLVARMAETAGSPLLDLDVGFSAPNKRAHVLFIGPVQTLDQRIAARTSLARLHLRRDTSAAFSLPREGEAPAPAVQSFAPAGNAGIGPVSSAYADTLQVTGERADWERQIGRPVSRPEGPFGRIAAALDELFADASRSVSELLPEAWQPDLASREPGFFGDESKEFDGAAVAVASPLSPRRTATVVTAADARMLERAVAALVQPATWYALRGDVAAWSLERPGAATARVSERFPLQDPPPTFEQRVLYWNSYFAEHPAFWMLLVLAAILALAVITRVGVSRRVGGA